MSEPPPQMSRDRDALVLALAAFVAYFARLWEGSLDGDAVIYASVAKGMAQSGDWLYTAVGSQPYFNKPPLLFWLTALLFTLFGTSTFTACFWSAAFGMASCLALHRLARELFDRPTAFCAAGVLILTPEMLRYATRFRLESACVFFMLLALLDTLRAARESDPRRLVRVGVWVGLVFLAKGGPGFIALGCVLGFLVWQGAGRLLWSRHAVWGLVWLLALAASWHVLQWARHGDMYFEVVVGRELLSNEGLGAQNPVLFYGWRLLRSHWVWLPFVGLGAWRLTRERAEQRDAFRLLVVWLAVGFVLISLPERKYARYLTSIYPAFALLAGYWFARALDPARYEQLRRGTPRVALAAAVVLVCLPFPIHPDDARPTRELGALLEVLAPDGAPVVAYRDVHGFWRGQMHFYLDRDLRRVDSLAELERSHSPVALCWRHYCQELARGGWKHHLESWRWSAYLNPALAARGSNASELFSRRLQ